MFIVVVDDGLFFLLGEPPVARNCAVVLIFLSEAVFPVVELAGAQAQPAKQLPRGDLGAGSPVLDVVDDLVTRVMGNPNALQGSPSTFFSCTCSCINSAMTSFFLTSLVWSFSTILA